MVPDSGEGDASRLTCIPSNPFWTATNGCATSPVTMFCELATVLVPMVDIVTIGAGGGSIVWRDDGDMLRVGPRSAGADPGPASYGRGGTEPTLTDAHVLCGRLPDDTKLAGKFALDPAAAQGAFAPLAAKLGGPAPEAAESAIRLAESNIVAAIRVVSTERGHDPRDVRAGSDEVRSDGSGANWQRPVRIGRVTQ